MTQKKHRPEPVIFGLLVGPPGLEPGTKGLWAASRNKTYYKSIGYKRSTEVWKQMWKQRLFTSTKLRTV